MSSLTPSFGISCSLKQDLNGFNLVSPDPRGPISTVFIFPLLLIHPARNVLFNLLFNVVVTNNLCVLLPRSFLIWTESLGVGCGGKSTCVEEAMDYATVISLKRTTVGSTVDCELEAHFRENGHLGLCQIVSQEGGGSSVSLLLISRRFCYQATCLRIPRCSGKEFLRPQLWSKALPTQCFLHFLLCTSQTCTVIQRLSLPPPFLQ